MDDLDSAKFMTLDELCDSFAWKIAGRAKRVKKKENPNEEIKCQSFTFDNIDNKFVEVLTNEEFNGVKFDLSESVVTHIISAESINPILFLEYFSKLATIEYALLSTWNFDIINLMKIKDLIDVNRLKHIDFYLAENILSRFPNVYEYLVNEEFEAKGDVIFFKNHSKVLVLKLSTGANLVILSSVNIQTHGNIEQSALHNNSGLANFVIDYFKTLKSDI